MTTHTEDTRLDALPDVPEDLIDRMEREVFAGIRSDARSRTARTRRSRAWIGTGAAAAIVAVAAFTAPSVIGAAFPTDSDSSVTSADAPAAGDGRQEVYGEADMAGGSVAEESAVDTAAREIITTATVVLTVDDVTAASDAVVDAARDAGGQLSGMTIGSTGAEPASSGDMMMPYPPAPTDGAYVTVKVPAGKLDAVLDDVRDLGRVESSTVDRQDVTMQAIDLRAQISASEASVARLTELMDQAASVGDLISAESALAERQGTLDSYRQQLTYLENDVAMSTLNVTLQPRSVPVEANPTGFGDGVAAGWNGLVAAVNGIVVGIGFLLPWLAVLAVGVLVVWGIVRLVRRGRRTGENPEIPGPTRPGT